jgi:hypothetical protein
MSTLATTNIKHPSSASNNIVLDSSGNVVLQAGSASTPALQPSGDTNTGIFFPAADTIAFAEDGVESARIDASGRLLVGTSSSVSTGSDAAIYQVFSNNTAGFVSLHLGFNSTAEASPVLAISRSRNTSYGSYTVVQNNDSLGRIRFAGDDGADYDSVAAQIEAFVDGTPGANDMPGRLVFSTTKNSEASPTEAMRITEAQLVLIGRTSSSEFTTIKGIMLHNSGLGVFTRDSDRALDVSRFTNDGDLVRFYQDGNQEGAISVSGSTVTYGGGHLARWSQLPNDGDPSSLLKGTVMSNLDEMCEWGEEDNEQLNKTKVSDVEGDPNVAGVFVSASFSDDGPLDYFCAMTGDMIIRIAEGTPVHRGQLLMSAGDGTAKPQGDGFVQDKTIAKVTSNHVTCTYEDGSYCVPCVLMAC